MTDGHRRSTTALTLLAALCFGTLTACAGGGLNKSRGPRRPSKITAKNVILLISDGCGYNQINVTNLYDGVAKQPYEAFPTSLAMATFSANGDGYDPDLAWTVFGYVKLGATDSASAATAMSTGIKTYDGMIGAILVGNIEAPGGWDDNWLDPDTPPFGAPKAPYGVRVQPLTHLMQTAEKLGKATGVVSSVQFSHATPAGFIAHNLSRGNYQDITREMVLVSEADVIMGCGHPFYNNDGQPQAPYYRYISPDVWQAIQAGTAGAGVDADHNGAADDAWTVIQDRGAFQALAAAASPPKRVLGIPKVLSTLQQSRGGNDKADPYVVPLTPTVPTLEEMTRAALNVLDGDPDGCILMVEGGAVDWAGHANQTGRLIEEERDFNNAVKAVIQWVQTHSSWDETLVIVTGDHETGYLTRKPNCPGDIPWADQPIAAWNQVQWNSGSHTNSLIPLFAKGPGADLFECLIVGTDPKRGDYVDNTSVADIILEVLK
jgi:alkaline phosphatase